MVVFIYRFFLGGIGLYNENHVKNKYLNEYTGGNTFVIVYSYVIRKKYSQSHSCNMLIYEKISIELFDYRMKSKDIY